MLSLLTVTKVGSTDYIEMYHSSPEGEDMAPLVGLFLHRKQPWKNAGAAEDFTVLRDSRGDLWIAESVVYEDICFSEHLK